ncbi:MAG: tetratricopeptide repeat protein [Archangiaceae bacterium]|nr:tetratricopeptide repeat protein [Archangiaceae bacterium]
MELTSAKTRVPPEQAAQPTNSIQSAEALAARGDYAAAIALYRKALEKRPDSDLIRERLAELFQIVQAVAPKVSAAADTSTSVAPAGVTPDGQAPVSTLRLLSDLLDQISRRRRTAPQKG